MALLEVKRMSHSFGGLKAVHDTRLSLALRHARPLEKL